MTNEPKVGDVVFNANLLQDGMLIEWASCTELLGKTPFNWPPAPELAGQVLHVGVRILARPATAIGYPLCIGCDDAEVAPGQACHKCNWLAPAAEEPAANHGCRCAKCKPTALTAVAAQREELYLATPTGGLSTRRGQ